MTERDASRHGNQLRTLGEVFSAGTTVTDPRLLVGRDRQVVDTVRTLYSPGLYPIIFGPSGIGKSTLAWQVEMIAKGSEEVLDSVGDKRYAPDSGNWYLTFSISCAISSICSGKDLLTTIAHQLQRKKSEFVRHAPMVPIEDHVKVKFPGFEAGRKYGHEQVAEDLPVGIDEILNKFASEVIDHYNQPILVIIDDLDQIEDTSGLVPFLNAVPKNFPEDAFRFILVGSAHRVKNLVRDYAELNRPVPIEMLPMPNADLIQIIQKRLAKLSGHGAVYQFAEELMRTIATVSAGVPSITTQLAWEAIRAAERDDTQTVTRDHVDQALKDFITLLQSRH